MKNKKRLVPWLIAAVIIAALAVIGKKLYDLMFGGSLAVTTEDLKNGIIACSPAIIFIVVVLIAALIVVVAAGKLKQPKRALVRAQAPIAILLAITLSVNWVILGVEYSVVNSVFAEDVKVSDETMASGRAIADQIASEGIVLLKNDDKALPLSAGTKLNLFGWSSVRPLYGGTGSGDSDTSNAVSLIDGLKHAGFEVNEELVKFYENFRTERPVGTIRLREIGSKRGDFTVPEPTIAEYENANIFEDAVAYSDTAVVVVSRTGGEGFDVPQSITGPDEYNAQYGGLAQFYDFTTQAEDLDAGKSYLELSNREIAMVDRVCKEFKNVIVVVNSSNAMELGWLDQYDSIKAAVLCGAPGELGFDSLGKILSGEVNPSGHLADAACSGFIYAIAAAHGLLSTLGGRYALVIGCEALSRMVDPTDRTTCVLFGDGAGAAILELAEDVPFAVTLGARGSEAIRVGGPAACDTAPITMDGKAVFRFAVETMPRCLQTVLERSQKTLADLDWVVCHQANSRIIDHCIKHLHAEPSKFYKNMDRHGNTSAASIPIALHEMVENDLLHPGQTLACIGFGGGLTWGGMLLTYEGRK